MAFVTSPVIDNLHLTGLVNPQFAYHNIVHYSFDFPPGVVISRARKFLENFQKINYNQTNISIKLCSWSHQVCNAKRLHF